MDTPATSIEAPGKVVLNELDRLRNANRLGIHMYEDDAKGRYPIKVQKLLQANEPGAHGPKPAISLSLLPATDAGFAMLPYDLGSDVGYLLDLSEDQPRPPVILGAHTGTMNSGSNAYNKRLAEKAAHLGLDAMAERFAELYSHLGVAPFNEVLAHAHPAHVKAIVATCFNPGRADMPGYSDYVRFSGALIGLAHLERAGKSPPVVAYHISGPDKNSFSYIGQSREELVAAATRALEGMARAPYLMHQLDADILMWNEAVHHLGAEAFERAHSAQSAGQTR